MKYDRLLNLQEILKKKSVLLLGPRQTGKSTLLSSLLGPETRFVDLTQANAVREYSANPERLREQLSENIRTIVVDEAQNVPELFDEMQGLLDRDKELRAVLSGSSARKLRRKGMNLLPGRVWRRELFPLVYPELGALRLEERAQRGSLPGVIDSDDFREELVNYVGLYLDEEVRAEGLTRNIGAFNRFLPVAALSNCEQLNFTEIANDTGIKLNTVRGYFEILTDTLLGSQLHPYRKTKTRKTVATPKFYFFDQGVVNALLNRFEVSPQSELYGKALEQILFQELQAFLSYRQKDLPLTYWRTQSKYEVDFLLGDEIAIEVKAKSIVTAKDERGLQALSEELKLKRKILVCLEKSRRRSAFGNEIVPVDEFLRELWDGAIDS